MLRSIVWLGACVLLVVACDSEPAQGPGSEPAQGPGSDGGELSRPEAGDGEHSPPESSAGASATGWNLVFITLDTTRADALGVYGQSRPVTPILDGIAADGVLFESAYTASPSTLPSHSTLLTGRLPFEHGVRSNAGYRLHEDNQTLAEVLGGYGYTNAAEVAAMVIARGTGIEQGFASFRDPASSGVRKKKVVVEVGDRTTGQDLPERDAADITQAALQLLSSTAEPFFLWLHYFDPHSFYAPPGSFGARFADSPYHGEVHYVDYQLGRLFSQLRTTGLRDRTLVVVTADHGEGLGEHGEASHSFFVYDSTMRIPLIFWGPQELPRGVRVDGVVSSADVAPTILDLLGLPPSPTMTGRSLRAAMRSGDAGPGPAYGESLEPLALFGSTGLRFLRKGRWKYHHKLFPELYDLDEDPFELDDVAEAHPDRLASLRRDLSAAVEHSAGPPDARVEVTEEDWLMLNALGYVGGAAPEDFSDTTDVAEARGPDPALRVEEVSRYAVAWAEVKTEDYARAREIFDELIAEHPESIPLFRGLIAALDGLGDDAALVDALRRALAIDPADVVLRSHLVRALGRAGRLDEARAEGEFLLARDECSTIGVLLLSELFRTSEQWEPQAEMLEAAASRCPKDLDIQNEYAYLLATARETPPRDPLRASRLARRIIEEDGGMRADYLDTLACASAARGRFQAAEKQALRAIELLRTANRPEAIAVVEAHLALFRDGKAVVEGAALEGVPVDQFRRKLFRGR